MDKRFLELDHGIKYTNTSKLFKNDFKEEIETNLNKEDLAKMPTDYNFFTYIPSAFGILIAKTFSKSMADIYYAGRLFNLISFMALMICTLKILPYKKKVFFTIATMPMVFLMSTVYSADMSCIGITFIFISYCLNLYNKEHIGLKEIIILVALFIILWIPKSMSYIFVAFMMLILPIKKIIMENKKYIPYVISAVVLICGIGLYVVANQNVPDDPRGGNTSKVEQIKYMTGNPLSVIKLGINHVRLTLLNFDWLKQLNLNLFFCDIASNIFLVMLIYILLVSLLDTSKNFKIKDRVILITTFLITYGVTSLILYLVFTPIGEDHINGYQTRYIFPILPLLLITISNNFVQAKRRENINTTMALISGIFLMLGVIGNIMVL